ncbi:MAG: OmpA family protein [Pseudomonadota bacterium]|nr:OmpA family protein [Pseudomonadota bacterium]
MKESHMNARTLALAVMTALIAACSSPPKPPTVDDSKKRPVNVSQAVDLQMCRTELSAAKIVLTETLSAPQRAALAVPAPVVLQPVVPQPDRASVTAEPNQVFVINFPLGSADFNVPRSQSAELIEQARAAKFILIRGRTDALADSMSETRLAQRRAEAAYKYLVDMVRLPPGGIRLSWQGAGDPFQQGATPFDRQANRRVEIEMYQVKPEIQVLTLLRNEPLRDLPRQVGAAD